MQAFNFLFGLSNQRSPLRRTEYTAREDKRDRTRFFLFFFFFTSQHHQRCLDQPQTFFLGCNQNPPGPLVLGSTLTRRHKIYYDYRWMHVELIYHTRTCIITYTRPDWYVINITSCVPFLINKRFILCFICELFYLLY